MTIRTLDDLAVEGAAIGVRVDINSPLTDEGALADDARLQAHVDTLAELGERGGRVAVLAHQGRPGGADFADLSAHAERLDALLEYPLGYVDATFSREARRRIGDLAPGEGVLLENTRFYSEEYMEFEPERAAETFLVERLAPVLDVYVNDAFAAAHRSQPSLVGFPSVLPSYAGRVMAREFDVLGHIEKTPTPRVYFLGGAKVTDALEVAGRALEEGLADAVLTAGIVGNVFLLAAGTDLGGRTATMVRRRGEDGVVDRAADLLDAHRDRIHLPEDVAVNLGGERYELPVEDLPIPEPIEDIGQATIEAYADEVRDAATAVLNGPAGVYENDLFEAGTRQVYGAAAEAGYSIVGGGDTAAALRRFGIEGFDHVSTGGGAVLRLLSGQPLPAIEALE